MSNRAFVLIVAMLLIAMVVQSVLVLYAPTPRIAVASTTPASVVRQSNEGNLVRIDIVAADVQVGGTIVTLSASKVQRAAVEIWSIQAAWLLSPDYMVRKTYDALEVGNGDRTFNFCAIKNPSQCIGPFKFKVQNDAVFLISD